VRRGEETVEETLEGVGGVIREVKQFCYLGDMLDSEGGVERSVITRVVAAWRKWREMAVLLINKGIPLENSSM
jgi:hypothetical protein